MSQLDVTAYLPREHTDPLWRRLAGARIFITGGTGLFGGWLLQSLEDVNSRLGLGITALMLSRQPQAFRATWKGRFTKFSYIHGDVRSFKQNGERYDVVMHMATTSAAETYNGFNQLEKYDILNSGTRNVLEHAIVAGAKRVLFTSSGAAYGQTPTRPVSETVPSQFNPLLPESALGLGKLSAEFLCAQYAASTCLQPVVARCFSFVGPGLPLNLHYAIGNFIKNAVNRQPITVQGDGTPVRSYLYLGDMVEWLLKILLDGTKGEIYNVGSDEAIGVADLARKVASICKPTLPVHILGNSTYQVGVPVRSIYVPDIGKARHDLGLSTRLNLESALKITYEYASRPDA